jgi:LPXTG-site transpeptidase (sortase) family protein
VAGTAIKLGTAGALLATVMVAQNRQDVAPRALADNVGYVRVAHLSPDTAPFDFVVTAAGQRAPAITLTNVAYGEVSRYQRVAPGPYTVTLRGTGTGERGTTLLTEPLRVEAGQAYTLTATGMRADLSMRVVGDDIRPAVGGKVRLRVFNAATKLDPAEVDIDRGVVLWQNIGFGTVSSYATVPAGKHTLQVFAPNSDEPATSLTVSLAANSVYSLTILDTVSGAQLEVRTDAAAPAAVPRGPVQTGYGGAAHLLAAPAMAASGVLAGDPASAAVPTLSGSGTLTGGPVPAEEHLLPVLPAAPAGYGPYLVVPPRTPVTPARGLLPGPAPGAVAVRAVPVELAIPRIGVHARVGTIRLNAAGALVPPASPSTIGWYAAGVVPGEPGPAVLAGHVDGPTGPAVFFNLGRLRTGDALEVRTADGKVLRYKVLSVKHYRKTAFPASTVYAATPDSELRLITCGGTFETARHSYLDNVVVNAVPV